MTIIIITAASVVVVVIGVGEYDFEFCEFHESYLVVVAEIGVDAVLVDVYDLHDSALLDEEEVLALGPGVLERVAEDLSALEEALVFIIEFVGDGELIGGVVALIEEEVVVLVLVVDALLE